MPVTVFSSNSLAGIEHVIVDFSMPSGSLATHYITPIFLTISPGLYDDMQTVAKDVQGQ